jgi:hypothetical protein
MDTLVIYQIRVKGHLDEIWKDLFDGFTISNLDGGEAVFSGRLPDQAALYGVLNRINSLGLVLISVNTLSEEG